jgi:hypothetical protein
MPQRPFDQRRARLYQKKPRITSTTSPLYMSTSSASL